VEDERRDHPALRDRLDAMTTAKLVDIVKRHELDEWRPEVFPIVESILEGRGVDVVALKAQAERDAAVASEDPPAFLRVMDLADPAILAVARSLLEEAGVPFFIRNEGTQNLFGGGQLGTGYNVFTGPPVLMVEPSRLDEVRELLEPLLTEGEPAPGGEEEP
jgi:putative signal transducing protein